MLKTILLILLAIFLIVWIIKIDIFLFRIITYASVVLILLVIYYL